MKDKYIYKISISLILSLILIFIVGVGTSYGAIEEDQYIGDIVSNSILDEDDNAIETGEKIVNALKEFGRYPMETIFKCYLNSVAHRTDIVQSIANLIDLDDLKFKILYSRKEIKNDIGLNEYINVKNYELDGKSFEGQIVKNIEKYINYEDSSKEYCKRRFTTDTEIPVIPVDLYNMVIGDIALVDVNIFNGADNHKDATSSKVWLFLSNLVSNIIHITFYICATFLITVLIIRGIQIVIYSINDPQKRKKQIDALNRFVYSVIMLVSTIVIMALSVFVSNAFLHDFNLEGSNEYPIRVNVEEAGYSFSTNLTGYFKYMSQIEGAGRVLEKFVYVILYLVAAVTNIIVVIVMLLRMLIMWLLTIIGPIIAVSYALNIDFPISYQDWIKIYLSLAIVQGIIALLYRIILEMI